MHGRYYLAAQQLRIALLRQIKVVQSPAAWPESYHSLWSMHFKCCLLAIMRIAVVTDWVELFEGLERQYVANHMWIVFHLNVPKCC
jgi:hypothetical protein